MRALLCTLYLWLAATDVLAAADLPAANVLRLSLIPDDPISATAFRIVAEAYRRLDIHVEAVPLPAERALSSAAQGLTDGDTVRIAGTEQRYPQLRPVPVPILNVDSIAYTTGRKLQLRDWDDLRPYPLCLRQGIKVVVNNTAGMEQVFGDSVPQVVQMLRAGRCQVAILSQMAWLDIDTLHAGPLRAHAPPLASTPLYHYLHQRHQWLLPRLQRALLALRDEGRLAAILAEQQQRVDAAKARQSFPGPD